jgi:hypothetical protein
MASITIMHGHKNLLFAAEVANQTGAEFEENGQWITITDTPTLTIPRSCYDDAFDPNGQRQRQGDSQLESAWRSLLLNKQGYLVYFGDDEIFISDEKPKDKRPQFLLRFPSDAEKQAAEEWAARAGFPSLTDYILEAVEAFNKVWSEQTRSD